MKRLAIILILLPLWGCGGSNAKKLAVCVAAVGKKATAIRQCLKEEPPAIKKADKHAKAIQEIVAEATETLTQIEDKQTSWERFEATVVRWFPWILGILFLLLGLKYKVHKAIGPIAEGIGGLLTPTTKRQAAIDRKLLDGDMTTREAVAARRGMLGRGYEKALKNSDAKIIS